MALGMLVHEGSVLIVILNAMRLLCNNRKTVTLTPGSLPETESNEDKAGATVSTPR